MRKGKENAEPSKIEELKPGYERVYTVTEYYDGPRSGIADYQSKAHLYSCIFDESASDYSELFRLMPIDDDTFRLALEDWAIWERWDAAHRSGDADLSTHPALPREAVRHKELKEILDTLLVIDPQKAITRIARFEPLGARDTQVKWEEPNQTSP